MANDHDPSLAWLAPAYRDALMAIAQTQGKPLQGVLEEAIALYLRYHAPSAPSLSLGQSYEDLEHEPDEVLLDFLAPPPQTPSLAPKTQHPPAHGLEDVEDDEPDEILPGFLDV